VPLIGTHRGGKKMKFKPLGNGALVRMVEREEETASGIVLPDTAKEKPQTAEVVVVGAHEDVKVSTGDVVVFRKYAETEFKIDDEDHLIVEGEDILGVVEG
jgi:chaperonin GroES